MGGGGSKAGTTTLSTTLQTPLTVSTLPEDLLPTSSVIVTPTKDITRAIRTSSAMTPKGAQQLALTPHYCPICMTWFSDILVSTCCQHNICDACLEACRGHRACLVGDNAEAVLSCPHCASTSFYVAPLEDGALSRSYHSDEAAGPPSFNHSSPLKVGSSFEEMRRKLRPFQQATMTNGKQGAVENYITTYVQRVIDSALLSFMQDRTQE